ncbi:MAG: Flagellar basal-body rod protein FlgG [Candidatus Dichloromethanomonas elyunquensis]|nr:MAG: Flagellar basal-body rod protein FlgG [Candidatus Dichloromethanomonas elyunquensis]
MLRGLYSAASGMMLNDQQIESIKKNIESVTKPGYRTESERVTSFPRLLVNRISNSVSEPPIPETTPLGIMGTGVYADRKYYSGEHGEMRKTDTMTDMAINSEGYFTIDTLAGERYTRNGHFQVDPSGMLRTAGGNLVLGENGPIGPLTTDFAVKLDGTIENNETHEVIDRLRIVNIPQENLQKDSLADLFTSLQPPAGAVREDIRIDQGFIEEANVNFDSEMVKMIQVLRSYSANQKVVQTNDSLMQKAVNEIGKV